MNYKAILLGLVFLSIIIAIFQTHFARNDNKVKFKPYTESSQLFTSTPNSEHVSTTPLPYYEKKREIAQKLADIYLTLENALHHSKPPTPKTLLQLKGIISELDPAHRLSAEHREETDPKSANTSVILDVCPEKYMGEKYRYPYYESAWVMQDCKNVKPLNQVGLHNSTNI